MRINILRRIDYYIGPIICRALLLYKSFSRPTPEHLINSAAEIKNCKNILVIKFFGMGTILLSSPSLRELKARYKSANITILTLPPNDELCKILPSIDEVICLNIDSPVKFVVSFTKIMLAIAKKKFDIIIDLEFLTNFSALVTLLSTILCNPKITVGFNSPVKWRNATHDISVSFDHSRHITAIFEKVVRSLGVEDYCTSFESEKKALLDNMDVEYMKNLCQANTDLKRCDFFISVNINAGELSLQRRWPKEYFAAVIRELIKRPGVAIFLIGGKGDMSYVSEFEKDLPSSSRIVNVCGKANNIKELIGIFKKCNLLITNDSGPLRIAHIMNLDTISFFGPETPHLYGPLGNKHRVFYTDLYCSPCLNIYNSKISYCKKNICLTAIKPETVLKAIEEDHPVFKKPFTDNPEIDR